jgi:hypothetical protein
MNGRSPLFRRSGALADAAAETAIKKTRGMAMCFTIPPMQVSAIVQMKNLSLFENRLRIELSRAVPMSFRGLAQVHMTGQRHRTLR